MYTLNELREAGRAVVELIDLEEIQGHDYIDALSHAVRFLQEPEVDNSYKCFSELFEKGSVLLPLYQKMKKMSA